MSRRRKEEYEEEENEKYVKKYVIKIQRCE